MATSKGETPKRVAARGRPPKFVDETVEQARKLCALGATDLEIADFFKIASSTLYLWKLEKPGFSEALKTAKDGPDDRVERSLYQRAIGYTHADVDIRVVNGVLVETPILKHYPPDPVSCIFWLKNRRPAEWRAEPQPPGGEDLAALFKRLAGKLPD